MFFVLSGIYILIGCLPGIGLAWRFCLIVAASAIFPVSVATDSYRFGLFVYDFGVLVLCGRMIVDSILKRNISNSEVGLFLIILSLISLALLEAAIVPVDKYFVRDFRIIIYILEAFVCIWVVRRCTLSALFVKYVFWMSGSASIVWWLLINAGFDIINDAYYLENSFRYIAVSTFMAATGLAFSDRIPTEAGRGVGMVFLEITLLVAVVVSGLRLLLLTTMIVYGVRRMRSLRGVGYLVLIVIFGTSTIAVSSSLRFEPVIQLGERLNEINSSQFGADLETRLSPIAYGDRASNFEESDSLASFVVGSGFGTTFLVPWFSYREGKDIYNNFIDSAYATVILKFGLLGVLILLLPGFLWGAYHGNSKFVEFLSITLFFGFLYIGYCLPYQIDTFGVWAAFSLLLCRHQRHRLINYQANEPHVMYIR